MLGQIARDLGGGRHGTGPQSIAYARRLVEREALAGVCVLSIEAGRVTTLPKKLRKRPRVIARYLRRMARRGIELPNVSFLIGPGDAWRFPPELSESDRRRLPPVCVFSASREYPFRDQLALFPDDHTLGDHLIGYRKGWARIYQEIKSIRERYPYRLRRPQAFWRGLPTDRVEDYPDGRSPRVRLTELSRAYPELLDAAFTTAPHFNKMLVKNFRPLMQSFSIPPYVSHAGHLRFQVLPCLDGKANTFPGLLWRLASGSVVIKQETSFQQWFYPLLEPWRDYVPAKQDMSDMLERLRWSVSNPEPSQSIAEHAARTVELHLKPDMIDRYIVLALRSYRELVA